MGAPLVPAIRVHRTSRRVVLVGLEHRASCGPVYLLHLAKMLPKFLSAIYSLDKKAPGGAVVARARCLPKAASYPYQ